MKRRANDGYVLVLALTMLVILGLMATTLTFTSLSTGRATGDERGRTQAFYASQSGLERASQRLTEASKSWAPSSIENAVTLLTGFTPIAGNLGSGQGTFSVNVTKLASTSEIATLEVRSFGKSSSGDAERILSTTVEIKLKGGNSGAFAPAALITTGNVNDNGSAPVAGENYSNSPSRTFVCEAGATAQPDSPCKVDLGGYFGYTLSTSVTSVNDIKSGQTYQYSYTEGGVTKTAQYVVQKVSYNSTTAPTKATFTLASLNETTSNQPMNNILRSSGSASLKRSNTSSILAPTGSNVKSNGNPTGTVCDPAVYSCSNYDFPTGSLFQLVFGTSKFDFMSIMESSGRYFVQGNSGTFTPQNCKNNSIMWVKATTSNFDLNCETSPTSPKIIVVDAKDLGSGGNFNLAAGTFSPFYGVVYVIAEKPIRMTGNDVFKGSVIAEAGTGLPTTNDETTAAGNGKEGVCPTVPAEKGGKGASKEAKICYDAAVMDTLNTIAQNALKTYSVNPLNNSWMEHSK